MGNSQIKTKTTTYYMGNMYVLLRLEASFVVFTNTTFFTDSVINIFDYVIIIVFNISDMLLQTIIRYELYLIYNKQVMKQEESSAYYF